MTPKLLPQFLTLLRHRLVEVFPAPVGDPLKRTAEPAAGCLPLDHPRTPTRAAPVVREPQQVKSAWWSFAAPGVFGRRLRWPLERHQSGLLRMESQAEPTETLGQNLQDPPCVFFTGKAHDEVVRITDHESPAPQSWFHFLLEPNIQHVVQVGVGQQGRDHPALRSDQR